MNLPLELSSLAYSDSNSGSGLQSSLLPLIHPRVMRAGPVVADACLDGAHVPLPTWKVHFFRIVGDGEIRRFILFRLVLAAI